MINNLIKDIALQTSNTEEENEIIIYGLKILGINILTAVLVILSGIIVGQPVSAILYLLVLILLRRNVGGYHSKTYIGCLFITLLNFMVIVVLQNNLNQNYKEVAGIIFIIYSTIKIYKTIPQVHKDRIVDEKTMEKCNVKKWIGNPFLDKTLLNTDFV